ncbi:hypothetical protein [Kribbella italica]|uniref:Uncharacterized protein n=1 Tax=Kribbella italica TaxID=1540520 RepID=A0A7W9J2H2_9ACTN|nr:hypothetical protein [Kribbella italica]MBB5834379.1 hypothetical protein [Kribbella italica]
MKTLIDEHPAVVEIEERRAKIDAAEAAYREWMAHEVEAHRQEVEAYEAAKEAAVQSGRRFEGQRPADSPTEDCDARLDRFRTERAMLDMERFRTVAALREELVQVARARYDDAISTVREHVEALSRILTEVRSLQVAVHTMATAQNELDAKDPRKGRRELEPIRSVDVAGLVDAAVSGRDLLAVQPERKLGQTGSWGGSTATAWEPPLPPEPQRVGGLTR